MTIKSVRYQDLGAEINDLATKILGAGIAVHRVIGPGHLEKPYESAICVEFDAQAIPYERQKRFDLKYRNVVIGESVVDLLVGGLIVVELKSVAELLPIHEAQVISYLKLTGCKLGLLINFNVPVLRMGIRRLVHPSLIH